MFSIYTRIKILTERGKEFSNIGLNYDSLQSGRQRLQH